jgi:hypothetical protein
MHKDYLKFIIDYYYLTIVAYILNYLEFTYKNHVLSKCKG